MGVKQAEAGGGQKRKVEGKGAVTQGNQKWAQWCELQEKNVGRKKKSECGTYHSQTGELKRERVLC